MRDILNILYEQIEEEKIAQFEEVVGQILEANGNKQVPQSLMTQFLDIANESFISYALSITPTEFLMMLSYYLHNTSF